VPGGEHLIGQLLMQHLKGGCNTRTQTYMHQVHSHPHPPTHTYASRTQSQSHAHPHAFNTDAFNTHYGTCIRHTHTHMHSAINTMCACTVDEPASTHTQSHTSHCH
jgi:hypothetical protein